MGLCARAMPRDYSTATPTLVKTKLMRPKLRLGLCLAASSPAGHHLASAFTLPVYGPT